ncbi:bifunctional tRNA (5-methylaminomethyl-2-thiouridine)(34)-methyltransferase MnmD/FAD-dependent 5-carboxymethylaminomethyl-2-thiouridine(34) oxidoreductase MnmC [Congregibacter brevis]|uniref:tRNA 5-methylaminomethyl-2-thiouridine biosynthesis bifunctional protein MnmC n=1 Tax=Congregibacter brevis TaxID=3081201 RepID=A0ABZ0IAS1_9GAMM|nr:bifunctional tRNA (5-methylaminomethyl-2-thiouridine)(34)-methyltransferase MnmD/FAD-dependent 5-carboxymethylaminomethyl-2-thiouridine(34) oxidoreductase MnmC [Congregibacter sp. IMCC45268]
MIRAKGPFRAMETAHLQWTEDGEPRSLLYDDCYFSPDNGLAESQYVFIEGSDLESRLSRQNTHLFTIAELGFGTGLNFLQSWQCFERFAGHDSRLHFWSVDRHPLSRDDFEQGLGRWPQLSEFASQLIAAYPPPLPGVHRRVFAGGRVTLDLVWADVQDALPELSSLQRPLVDAWYLDGFAPRQNEAMWMPELFGHMIDASKPSATIATFSASGAVRRDLETAGFRMSKRPGFGRKRECLQGVVVEDACTGQAPPAMTPWDLNTSTAFTCHPSALVIGAGLAGAHAAAALARRGIAVTVLDESTAAGGGSGNAQGVLFTRLSYERSILGEFSLAAFLFARELYQRMFEDGSLAAGVDGALSGCVQTDTPRGDGSTLASALVGLEAVAQSSSAEQVETLLGIAGAAPGLWQPGSGWLSPPAVCRALLGQDGITLREQCGELNFTQTKDGLWEVRDTKGELHGTAPVLVLATGPGGRSIEQTKNLPLRVVRGQTTQIPAPKDKPLLTSFCHRGYITPALNGEHCIGATFKPGDASKEMRVEENRDNLEALGRALPAWKEHLGALDPAKLRGRAELRCVSPDYLPVAGPVPDESVFTERFSALQWDASQIIPEHGAYLSGLFVSTAHGSRGLSYAAMSAELIATQVLGEPIPVSRELQRALCPARFLIRGLVRGKPRSKARTA